MDFPSVTSHTSSTGQIELNLFMNETLSAFNGHFDGAPIIPGVVQIEWVLHFARQYFLLSTECAVVRMDALKFQNVIQPSYSVLLTLQLVDDKLHFSFTSGEQRHSSGKLLLAL